MTPRERFLAAVRREEPDRVPVAPLIHCRYAHTVLGRTDWRAVFEVHQKAGSIAFRGPQGVGCRVEWPDGWRHESRVVQDGSGGTVTESRIITPHGTLTQKHIAGMIPHDPITGKTVEYYIKDHDDYRVYIKYLEKSLETMAPAPEGFAEVMETMGEEGIASVGQGSALDHLGGMRGMEPLLMDVYDRPQTLEAVFSLLAEAKRRDVQSFLQSAGEVLWYDICWASCSTMSPETFRKYVLPDVAALADAVRSAAGKYCGVYTLGKMRALLPMLVDTSVDFIETFEMNQGDISLAEAKRTYGDRVCIMGNYDCVVLARGTLQEAREEARRCLREGMEGGGYVMVTADEVPGDTKWDNLRAMVEVAEEEGEY